MKKPYILTALLISVTILPVSALPASVAQLLKEKKYEEAIDPLNDYVKENPEDFYGNYFLGFSMAHTGDYKTAITYLEISLEEAKKSDSNFIYQVYNDLGWTQFLAGMDSEAIRNLSMAAEADPQKAGPLVPEIALNNLGLVYSHLKDFKKSEDSFSRAVIEFDSEAARINLESLQIEIRNQKISP